MLSGVHVSKYGEKTWVGRAGAARAVPGEAARIEARKAMPARTRTRRMVSLQADSVGRRRLSCGRLTPPLAKSERSGWGPCHRPCVADEAGRSLGGAPS